MGYAVDYYFDGFLCPKIKKGVIVNYEKKYQADFKVYNRNGYSGSAACN